MGKVRKGEHNNARKSATHFHRPQIVLFLVFFVCIQFVAAIPQDDGGNDNSINSTGDGNFPTGLTTLESVITTMSSASFTLTTVASHVPVFNATSISSNTMPSATHDTASSTSSVSIPRPFDTAKLSDTGANFTSTTCPGFMRKFVSDPNFYNCVPFSLLLYTSVGFTAITRQVCLSPICSLILRGDLQ